MISKQCHLCKEEKPLEDYNRDNRSPDGLHYRCRACVHNRYYAGNPLPKKIVLTPTQEGYKICYVCREEKPLSEFYKRNSGRQKGSLRSECKACGVEQQKYWRSKETTKERLSLKWKLKKYGMTMQEYTEMLDKQAGACAICKNLVARLCIDHCHDTGRVRGILCNNCNLGIGSLKHNADILKSAIDYLQ